MSHVFANATIAAAALLSLACASKIDVEIDVNGTNADNLTTVFYGLGQIDREPFVVDGFEFDANGDGVFDEQDVRSAEFLVVAASSGEVGCEAFAEAFEARESLVVDGTFFSLGVSSFSHASDAQLFIQEGAVIQNVEEESVGVRVSAVFDVIEGGVAVEGVSVAGATGLQAEILALDEDLSIALRGDLANDAGELFPVTAEILRAEHCQPLTDAILKEISLQE